MVRRITSALGASGFDAKRLEVEVTETAAVLFGVEREEPTASGPELPELLDAVAGGRSQGLDAVTLPLFGRVGTPDGAGIDVPHPDSRTPDIGP